MSEAMLTVTQVRSSIGTKPKHRATLRALGLRKIGATNSLPDRPEIRGMIRRVDHLISIVAEAGSGSLSAATATTKAKDAASAGASKSESSSAVKASASTKKEAKEKKEASK